MSTDPAIEIVQVQRFLGEQIKAGAPLMPEEALALWRSEHPSAEDFRETVAALREALADMDSGDAGLSLDDFDADFASVMDCPEVHAQDGSNSSTRAAELLNCRVPLSGAVCRPTSRTSSPRNAPSAAIYGAFRGEGAAKIGNSFSAAQQHRTGPRTQRRRAQSHADRYTGRG